MTRYGFTLLTEQSGPNELVRYASDAEEAGFDFLACSDHYSPWLPEQGHAPFVWSVLGAVAHATDQIDLMTYVTCPTMRYHPAVVAQQAATVQLLSDGRFTLGLGSGENLNEHVVGRGWPPLRVRHDMLAEAAAIIRDLLAGETVSTDGPHFPVDNARLWDLSPTRVPIGIAMSGPRSLARFTPLADHLIAVAPDADLVTSWHHGVDHADEPGAPRRAIGQIPICWDPDADRAAKRAHEQFRWFGGGWTVNSDLASPAAFAAASKAVRPSQIATELACGPDLDAIAAAVHSYERAGFTDVAIVQIGDQSQEQFLAEAAVPLLKALRSIG